MTSNFSKFMLAAMAALTVASAQSSTLGYGTIRPRVLQDSTIGPSLTGVPVVWRPKQPEETKNPPTGGFFERKINSLFIWRRWQQVWLRLP